MFNLRASIFEIFVIFATPLYGADRTPTFVDFRVSVQVPARNSQPQIRSRLAKEFKTVLVREAENPVNFAGHYRLVNLGCGAGCIFPAIIDVTNGKVVIPGFHIGAARADRSSVLMEFNPNSRLLVLNGDLNEMGKEVGKHYYEWHAGRLKRIQLIRGLPHEP